jgi:ribonuclease T1
VRKKSPLVFIISIILAVLGFFYQQSQQSRSVANTVPTSNSGAVLTNANSLVVRNQKILDQNGKIIFIGDVDLAPTLARIARGERDSHPNDGSVHRNREGKLPQQADKNYYLEYVVRTPKVRSVGPQRLILGKQQEIFYTPNHYQTFLKLR